MSRIEKALLNLDNNPEIMDCCFDDGSSVWLTLRFQIRLIFLQVNSGIEASNNSKKTNPKTNLIKYVFHSLFHSPWKNSSTIDILSIANYEGDPSCPNRMTDFLKLQNSFKRRELLYSSKYRMFSGLRNTYNFDYFYYKSLIIKKFKNTKLDSSKDTKFEKIFELVMDECKDFLTKSHILTLKQYIYHVDFLSVNYRKQIQRYLKKTKPKLIVMSEGNNGDWKSGIIFSLAHLLSIPTVEVQHGAFNIGMWYGEKLIGQMKFKNQKSDYLFTFGKFHCSKTNVSQVCIPFGHYHLEKMTRNLIKKIPTDDKVLNLLFICEGEPPSSINNGLILNTISGLKLCNRPFNMVIRLHPSEEPNAKYDEFLNFGSCRYSTYKQDNIYQLIEDCDLVIGHNSTVLYEAVYFQKPVLIYSDDSSKNDIPEKLGAWYRTGQELADMLHEFERKSMPSFGNEFWAEGNVKDNFLKFWNSEIFKSDNDNYMLNLK